MLTIHQIEATPELWERVGRMSEHTVYQTRPWMEFLAETQGARPVWGEVRDGSSVVGYFFGLTFQRMGVRILGSPFPGWTTIYQGFCLKPGTPRWQALEALSQFAFHELGCLHFEIADRYLTAEDGDRLGLQYGWVDSYEHDLEKEEEQLFKEMNSACRRCIRKAEKTGLTVEEATPDGFAAEYYDQLKEVFLKQGLVPTYDQERVEALIRHLHPTGNLLLLRARDPEGAGVATGIYPGLNQIAQFWGNASYGSGQQYRPNETLHWHAMRYWKQRGVKVFDWGGGGTYKEKYGCKPIRVPWLRKSRYPGMEQMRGLAQNMVQTSLRIRGRWKERAMPEPEPEA